ncbi:MAG TPA: hypothetical protein PKD64_03285 [Pirellulaceae bacterium]|nr:hypothetical protein [Pirellulaceae bacterium]HMO91194.1 hypothetical protein [Pirellulaceae bacterium]HMP69036.1 hypothetical protein [Pirellulaceae bacterium]
MRLAFVIRRFWPLMNEPEYAAADLAEALSQMGHEVTIISSRPYANCPSMFTFRKSIVIRLPEKFPTFRGNRPFEKEVTRFLRARPQDFDAVVFFPGTIFAWTLVDQLIQLGVKCCVRLEPSGFDSFQLFAGNVDRNVEKHLKQTPPHLKYFSSSKLLALELQRQGFDVPWVPNAIRAKTLAQIQAEQQQFAPLDIKLKTREALSNSHPILRTKTDEKLAIIAGPITASQRLDRWLYSLKAIKKIPLPKFWIIGEGNRQQDLWDLSITLNVNGYLVLGFVLDDLSVALGAADVYLFSDPLRIDSPFTLLAQAFQIPILASFEGPLPDYALDVIPRQMQVHSLQSDTLPDAISSIFAENTEANTENASEKLGGHNSGQSFTIAESAMLLLELIDAIPS